MFFFKSPTLPPVFLRGPLTPLCTQVDCHLSRWGISNYDWIFTNWNHMFYSFQTDGNNKSEVQTQNGSSFSQLENRNGTMIELTLSRSFKWFIQAARHRRDYLTAEMFKHCKPLFDKDIYLTYNSERHLSWHKYCALHPPGIYNTIRLDSFWLSDTETYYTYRYPYLYFLDIDIDSVTM